MIVPARPLEPSARSLPVATVAFVLADWAYRQVGDSCVPGGPLDEIAHLSTTLIILWVLGRRVCDRFLVPALIASVAIDADHIPGELGSDIITRGTPRPYTHSLLTIVVVLVAAVLWRRRRDILLGVAIGLGIHFWRDMAESDAGVSLLWPFSDHPFTFSHTLYLVVMAAFVALAAIRCRRPARRRACHAS